jgi:hypothetical protein
MAVPVGVLLLLIGFLLIQFSSGFRVTVHNTGAKSVHSVVLHVHGGSYSVGDIAPGEFVEATMNRTSESHLEIEFREADGTQKHVSVVCSPVGSGRNGQQINVR